MSTERRADAAVASFFGSPAVDHAVAGGVAGTISTLCMNPLDLLKTRFQVNQSAFSSVPSERSLFYQSIARRPWLYYAMGGKPVVDIVDGIHGIYRRDGVSGLYRGVVPNVIGNAASWGLYFLWYTMIKDYMVRHYDHEGSQPVRLSAGGHLLAATGSGVITAFMTNPIWVVKTRMFTTTTTEPPLLKPGVSGSHAPGTDPSSAGLAHGAKRPVAYRGLVHGLVHTYQTESLRGLYKGVGLAVLGVSNGAIQFMAYEQLKQWRSAAKLQRTTGQRRGFSERELDSVKLSNVDYTILSGVAKLIAITLTYPYQVVRSRVQNHATAHLYPNAWVCVRRTVQDEGVRALYRGFVTNAVRILPGTCVTFVAYENVAWMLRVAAAHRVRKQAAVTSEA